MSTPYEKEYNVTTTGANEVVELPFPGRCELARLTLVRLGGGDITVDVFNRKFIGAEHDIFQIVDDGGGKVKINLTDSAAVFDDVRVGDILEVAGSSVAGYNVATHRIVSIAIDLKSVVTSESFTAVGNGGTVKLNIPAAEQPLYRVIPQFTDTDDTIQIPNASGDTIPYHNNDPLPNVNIGVKRKIYLKFAQAASYKVILAALMNVAGEG